MTTLYYRLTKNIEGGNGLEKRICKNSYGQDCYEIKFNTSIHVPWASNENQEGCYKQSILDDFTDQLARTGYQADQRKNACRAKRKGDRSCGSMYQPSRWLTILSQSLLASGTMSDYTLSSVGLCTHKNEKNEWHLELTYHKAVNDLPWVINIHMKHSQGASKVRDFSSFFRGQVSKMLPAACMAMAKYCDLLLDLNVGNSAAKGFWVKPYGPALTQQPNFPASAKQISPVPQPISSMDILARAIQSLQLNANVLQQDIQAYGGSSQCSIEDKALLSNKKQQLAACRKKIKTHQKSFAQLALSSNERASNMPAPQYSSARFFSSKPKPAPGITRDCKSMAMNV